MDQKCPVCSYENPEDALYCSMCKYVFRKEERKEPYDPYVSTSKESKSSIIPKVIIILIIAAIGFGIWKACSYFYLSHKGCNPAAKYDVIIDVNDINFDSEVLNSKPPVLVYFYSSTCKPSWRLMPELLSLSKSLEGMLKIAKAEVATVHKLNSKGIPNPIISNRYKFPELPTVIIFDEGKEIFREFCEKTGSRHTDPTYVKEINKLLMKLLIKRYLESIQKHPLPER